MNKILSICIASYNKAETTYSLVNSLLTCPNPDFEIVVVDNASTDETLELLGEIRDERLRVKCNEHNIGGASNMAKAFFAGDGLFSFYTNDRDIVYPEKLDAFIDFLKNNQDIGGGHCVRVKLPEDIPFVKHQGVPGLLKMAFRDEHPTGYFFKRVLLNEISNDKVERYVKPANYATFFWENFLCEIMCKGYPVVQYNDVIWKSTGNQTHSKYVSGFVSMDDNSDRWFYADHCLRRVIGNTEDVFRLADENNIVLTEAERYLLYAHLIVSEYTFGVYRNKVIHETPSLAFHYKVSVRKMSKDDMKNNKNLITNGYIGYIRKRENGEKELEKYILDSVKNVDAKYKMTIRRYLAGIKASLVNWHFGNN